MVHNLFSCKVYSMMQHCWVVVSLTGHYKLYILKMFTFSSANVIIDQWSGKKRKYFNNLTMYCIDLIMYWSEMNDLLNQTYLCNHHCHAEEVCIFRCAGEPFRRSALPLHQTCWAARTGAACRNTSAPPWQTPTWAWAQTPSLAHSSHNTRMQIWLLIILWLIILTNHLRFHN